jgi:lipopolysaccharide export system ATP-binding protein
MNDQPEQMEAAAPSLPAEEKAKREIRTEDLVKIYSKRIVVNTVSIRVRQGEIVGLLGPNGAGKRPRFI